MSQSLMSQDRATAKKKGLVALSAWLGTGVFFYYTTFGGILLGVGAAFLTYRWFIYRAKRGMRF